MIIFIHLLHRWRSETFVWFVQELDGSISKVQRLTEWRHRSTHAWQRGVLQRHLEKWRSYQHGNRMEHRLWFIEAALLGVILRAWRNYSTLLFKKRKHATSLAPRATMKHIIRIWSKITNERIVCREIICRMVDQFRCTTIGSGFAIWQQEVENFFRSKDLLLKFVLRMNNVKKTQGFLHWKHQSIVAIQQIEANLAHLRYFQTIQARKSFMRKISLAFNKWRKVAKTADWQEAFIKRHLYSGTLRRRLLQWRRNALGSLKIGYKESVDKIARLRQVLLARTVKRLVRKAFSGSLSIWRYITRMKRRVHIIFSRLVHVSLSLALEKWRKMCVEVKKCVAQVMVTFGARMRGSAFFVWREQIHRAEKIKIKIIGFLFRKQRTGFLRWRQIHFKKVQCRWQYNWLRGRICRILKAYQGALFRRWRRTTDKISFIAEHALQSRLVLGQLLGIKQLALANNLIKMLLHNVQHACKDAFDHWRLHKFSVIRSRKECVYNWIGRRLKIRWQHWIYYMYASRKASRAEVVARVLPSFRKAFIFDSWTRFSARQKIWRMLRFLGNRITLARVSQRFLRWHALAADHNFVEYHLTNICVNLEHSSLRFSLQKFRRFIVLYKSLRCLVNHTYRRATSMGLLKWQRASLADCKQEISSAEKHILGKAITTKKKQRFEAWLYLAEDARRKRRIMNQVLVHISRGSLGICFRVWKQTFKVKRAWIFLVEIWVRGTPFLGFQRWLKYTRCVSAFDRFISVSLVLSAWRDIESVFEKWKKVSKRHSLVCKILRRTKALQTAQALSLLQRNIQKRYWKLSVCSRNLEKLSRYWLLLKTQGYFFRWSQRTQHTRTAAIRLVSSTSSGRRNKVRSAFEKIKQSADTFRGAKVIFIRTLRSMMRASLIMSLSQWKRAIVLMQARETRVLRFVIAKVRSKLIYGLARWQRNTKHMTLHMAYELHRCSEEESLRTFVRYRANIVTNLFQRRQRTFSRNIINAWNKITSVRRHLKHWLSRAVNYKVSVVMKAAMRAWRSLSMTEAYRELIFRSTRDRRELESLRAEVGEVRGQKQQVSDQLNYSMHVLEYVMANQ